ncbi:hypothetical protein Natpe_1907 [Natrinema pellirubrum DSM 15624]|uniref:Uncharacterized protein n=1 Tax=Natrinema pellirubrum (strain DSM 15624 / CIP 106293 / JCM 10476 / NCIMB 786 / 157) TaxID=797303 RepID=L0JJQ4_NATP1|nr:hypothetical protein Natpe_1907 [Natrinema pellirubrum DSM 15624]
MRVFSSLRTAHSATIWSSAPSPSPLERVRCRTGLRSSGGCRSVSDSHGRSARRSDSYSSPPFVAAFAGGCTSTSLIGCGSVLLIGRCATSSRVRPVAIEPEDFADHEVLRVRVQVVRIGCRIGGRCLMLLSPDSAVFHTACEALALSAALPMDVPPSVAASRSAAYTARAVYLIFSVTVARTETESYFPYRTRGAESTVVQVYTRIQDWEAVQGSMPSIWSSISSILAKIKHVIGASTRPPKQDSRWRTNDQRQNCRPT